MVYWFCYCFSVQENEKAIIEEQKQDAKFQEIIVSCKSLSRYDGKTFKTLIPQVSYEFWIVIIAS